MVSEKQLLEKAIQFQKLSIRLRLCGLQFYNLIEIKTGINKFTDESGDMMDLRDKLDRPDVCGIVNIEDIKKIL